METDNNHNRNMTGLLLKEDLRDCEHRIRELEGEINRFKGSLVLVILFANLVIAPFVTRFLAWLMEHW